MEVLRLHGYTEREKLEIAKQYLVKKQSEQAGLTEKNIDFHGRSASSSDSQYTREAGVRNLEREIGNVCRKVARKVVKEGEKLHGIDHRGERRRISGRAQVPRHPGAREERNRTGDRTGLDRSRRLAS